MFKNLCTHSSTLITMITQITMITEEKEKPEKFIRTYESTKRKLNFLRAKKGFKCASDAIEYLFEIRDRYVKLKSEGILGDKKLSSEQIFRKAMENYEKTLSSEDLKRYYIILVKEIEVKYKKLEDEPKDKIQS